VDENLEFKNILAASNSDGTQKVMYLLPYAKGVTYIDGVLSMSLEFVNEHAETEVGIQMEVADELKEIFEKIEYGVV
jgi:hypothetical protein